MQITAINDFIVWVLVSQSVSLSVTRVTVLTHALDGATST